jgi:hypothetical protein
VAGRDSPSQRRMACPSADPTRGLVARHRQVFQFRRCGVGVALETSAAQYYSGTGGSKIQARRNNHTGQNAKGASQAFPDRKAGPVAGRFVVDPCKVVAGGEAARRLRSVFWSGDRRKFAGGHSESIFLPSGLVSLAAPRMTHPACQRKEDKHNGGSAGARNDRCCVARQASALAHPPES